MSTAFRRALASVLAIAGFALPMSGLIATEASAATAPASVQVSEDKPSKDAIQKVLKSIQDCKKPDDLKKQLDKDIKTLKHNEPAVPHKLKKEYNKFIQELRMAKEHKLLDGPTGSSVLKKIQADAKKLSEDLKKA